MKNTLCRLLATVLFLTGMSVGAFAQQFKLAEVESFFKTNAEDLDETLLKKQFKFTGRHASTESYRKKVGSDLVSVDFSVKGWNKVTIFGWGESSATAKQLITQVKAAHYELEKSFSENGVTMDIYIHRSKGLRIAIGVAAPLKRMSVTLEDINA
jgi:hypothetical protein